MISTRNLIQPSTLCLIMSLLLVGCIHRAPDIVMEKPEKVETGDVSVQVMPVKNEKVIGSYLIENRRGDREALQQLSGIIEEQLLAQGYTMSLQAADFIIHVDVDSKVFDEFAGQVLCDVEVKAEIFGRPALNLLGSKSFSSRSDRKMGKNSATENAIEKLTRQIKSWLNETLTPGKLGSKSTKVVVGLPEDSPIKPSAMAAAYVLEISSYPGVSSCSILETDDVQLTLLIDHHESAFPEGITNRLENLKGLVKSDLYKTDVTVTIPDPYRMTPSEYAITFIEEVSAVHGIHKCKVANSHQASREIVFEIEFFSEDIPEGIINRIVTIDSLDLGRK